MARTPPRRDVSGYQWVALIVIGFGIWIVYSGDVRTAAGSSRSSGRTSPLNLHGNDAVVFGIATMLVGTGMWCLMRGVANNSRNWILTGLGMVALALVGAVIGVIVV